MQAIPDSGVNGPRGKLLADDPKNTTGEVVLAKQLIGGPGG